LLQNYIKDVQRKISATEQAVKVIDFGYVKKTDEFLA